MMNFRKKLLWLIGLAILILVIALYTFSARDQQPAQVFSATVNQDCAPWDGSAFTVSIPYDPVSSITISIWGSPDIKFPSTFWFPNETGQVGYAYILPELGPLTQLSGKVSFQRVEGGRPVEGEFDLRDESGKGFKGKFNAEWGNEIIACG